MAKKGSSKFNHYDFYPKPISYKYKKHFTKMLADVGIKSLKLQKQDRRDLSLNRDQIPKTTKTRL